MRVSIDFETFSEADLPKTGAWRYAEDRSTEILCMAYSVERAPPKLWLPDMPFPAEVLEAKELWAWNAQFEIAVWIHQLKRRFGLTVPKMERWRCSMSLALSFALPGSLHGASGALGTPGKDPKGTRLITKFCKPRKPTKHDARTRVMPGDDPVAFTELTEYCRRDVVAEQAVVDQLPARDLPASELSMFWVDMRANARGIRVDMKVVETIRAAIARHGSKLSHELGALTGGLKAKQVAELRRWLLGQGVDLPDLTAETVEAALKHDLPPKPRRALQIRASLAQSSVTKYNAIATSVCRDGRLRGVVQYMGAGRTGRWAGRLLQVQNLPKGSLGKGTPELVDLKVIGDPDALSAVDEPLEIYSSLIRSMLIASEGHKLVVADYSSIEARVNAWLTGDLDMIDAFNRGVDVYCLMASLIFGREITKADTFERFLGKQTTLGCGYGMGVDRFMGHCEDIGTPIERDVAELGVHGYRANRPRVVAFWRAVNEAAIEAVRSMGAVTAAGPLRFKCTKRWLQMRLPSGRLLSYFMPKLEQGKYGLEVRYLGVSTRTKDWGWQHTYGGKLTENACQAIARDLMADAILRVQGAGYTYLTSVHDELICEHERPDLDEFIELMTTVPEWARGCPVAAEGWVGDRYRK